MLRRLLKTKESDRYISARSVEREKVIERFTIREDKGNL